MPDISRRFCRFARTPSVRPRWRGMEGDPFSKSPATRLAEVLEKAARTRRFALMLSGDAAAPRLAQLAEELMAEAAGIEAELHAADACLRPAHPPD